MRSAGLPSTASLVAYIAEHVRGVRVETFDGNAAGPSDPITTIIINSPRALVRMLRAPRGLGLARAWIAGEISIEGDLDHLVRQERSLRDLHLLTLAFPLAMRTSMALGYRELLAAGPTAVEARKIMPARHDRKSDIAAANFHYSRSPRFFELLLGPSMVYSGALFIEGAETLEDAQDQKHLRICRKLKLSQESRVLDVGCGWGSFLEFASRKYQCAGTGITASQVQHARATANANRSITYINGDYRDVLPLMGMTAAVSIGMYEHVGRRNSPNFFQKVRRSLPPGSLYLNQAIIRGDGAMRRLRRNAFMQRYVFPNGQLLALARQLRDMEHAGFTILSVERFGESYAKTIRCWQANLRDNWDECAALEGAERARVWDMYLAGARARFEDGTIDLAQVLAEAR